MPEPSDRDRLLTRPVARVPRVGASPRTCLPAVPLLDLVLYGNRHDREAMQASSSGKRGSPVFRVSAFRQPFPALIFFVLLVLLVAG
jgi:hypothetical protein